MGPWAWRLSRGVSRAQVHTQRDGNRAGQFTATSRLVPVSTGTLKSYFLARFPDTIPAMNCHCHAVLEVPGGLLTPHPHPGRVCSAHTPLTPHPPLRRRAAWRLGFLRLAESSDVLSGFLSGSAVSRASRPPGPAVLSPVAASASSLRLSRTPLQVSRRFRPADSAGRLVSWLL